MSYKPMAHLNGNMLCVVDTETTGTDPEKHDIIEVAAVPLLPNLEINTDILPFSMTMKPLKPMNVDPDALRTVGMEHDVIDKKKLMHSKRTLSDLILNGMDPHFSAELFMEWFEKLNLPFRKKLIPVAHNWPFDREFLKRWLGPKSFDICFHPLYRDTMSMSLFENDIAAYRGYPYPFQKNNLNYLCAEMKIERLHGHEALADCYNTAVVFKRLIQGSATRYKNDHVDDQPNEKDVL